MLLPTTTLTLLPSTWGSPVPCQAIDKMIVDENNLSQMLLEETNFDQMMMILDQIQEMVEPLT